jgi:hypothetical protein
VIDYATWLGHRGVVATRKAGKPGWLAFAIRCVGEDAIVTGGVPVGATKKGKPKWRKPYDEVCVTEAEFQAERRSYEQTTGKCADCEGSGQTWCGWNHVTGNRFKPCRRCDAKGEVAGGA